MFPPHLARASVRAFAFLVCLALFLAIRPAAAHPATLAPAQQASGATSQLTVSGTPRANGADLATITVTVRDGAGAPLANQTVWLTVSGSDNTLAGVPGTTDATGIATATLQSTQAETKVIRARVGAGSSWTWLPGSAQVTFSGASLSGTLFVDANQDGGQDAGESPLAGVQVALYSASGESLLRSTVSDESGQYTFTTLTAGSYRVRATPPGPYAPSQVEGLLVSVSAFESSTDQDLGVYAAAHLRGTVWQDANADGLRQFGEAGLGEAELYALDEVEGLRASTQSAASGEYELAIPATAPAAPTNFTLAQGPFPLQEPASARIPNADFALPVRTLPASSGPTNADFATGNLTGWSTSGAAVSVVSDTYSVAGPYLLLDGANQWAESSAFTVPAEAQSLRFRYFAWASTDARTYADFSLHALSGPTFSTQTDLAAEGPALSGNQLGGWQVGVVNLQPFAGQTIKLRVASDTLWQRNGRLRLDDLALGVEVPDWQPSSLRRVRVVSDTAGAHLYFDGANLSAESSAFTVPAGTQSLRFRYLAWTPDYAPRLVPLIAEVLSGATFATVTDLDPGSSLLVGSRQAGWQEAVLDLQAFAGQTIKLRITSDTLSQRNGRLRVDQVALYQELPGWRATPGRDAQIVPTLTVTEPDGDAPGNLTFSQGPQPLASATYPDNYDFTQGASLFATSTYPANYDFATGDLTGWSTSGAAVSVVSDTNSLTGPHLLLNAATEWAQSSAFTVPAEAQSLHFDYFAWRPGEPAASVPLVVYALSGPDFATQTDLTLGETFLGGSQNDGWRAGIVNLQPFAGQTIKLRVHSDPNGQSQGRLRLDNLALAREIPDWQPFNPRVVRVVSDTSNLAGPHLLLDGPGLWADSAPLTVPAEAQGLRFDYFAWRPGEPAASVPLVVYALSGPDFATQTDLTFGEASVGGSQNDGWEVGLVNLQPFAGQTIKLRFHSDPNGQSQGRLRLDNIAFAREIPAWQPANPRFVRVVSDTHNLSGNHLYLSRSTLSAQSERFRVPTDTMTLTLAYRNEIWGNSGAGSNLYVYALSDEDSATETLLASLSGSAAQGWLTGTVSLAPFRGQVIRLRLNSEPNGQVQGDSRVDNLQFISGSAVAAPAPYVGQEHLLFTHRGSTSVVRSAPFAVPATATQLRLAYQNGWRSSALVSIPLHIYAESGPAFGTSTLLGSVSGSWVEGWKTAELSLAAFQGQTIRLRFQGDNDAQRRSRIDAVSLLPRATGDYDLLALAPPGYAPTTPAQPSLSLQAGDEAVLDFGAVATATLSTTLAISPTTLVADGASTATVTVTLRDGNGDPVAGQAVEILAPGRRITLTQPSGVTNAQGQVTAALRSTRAQTISVTARRTGDRATLVAAQPLTFTAGLPVSTTSTLQVTPGTVVANGSDAARVTVMVRDAHNNPVAGRVVTVTTDGTGIQLTLDNATSDGRGRVTGRLRSTQAQTVTVQARDVASQTLLGQGVALTFSSTDPVLSSVAVSPATLAADGVTTATVTVTLRDQHGQPLPGKVVELAASGSGLYLQGQLLGARRAIGTSAADGTATAVVTATRTGLKTITAYGDTILLLDDAPLNVTAGPVDGTKSRLSASPAGPLAADGVAETILTIQAYDIFSNTVPGATVQLTSTAGTLAQPLGPTSSLGQITGTLRSSASGLVTVTATISGVSVLQPVVIRFRGADLALGQTAIAPSNSGPSSEKALAGHAITYTLTVQNQGLLAAAGVTLSDTLPGAVSFLTQTSAYTFTQNAGSLLWEIGALAPSQSATVLVVGTVQTGTLGTITNQALAASSSSEDSLTNNSSSLVTTVERPMPLLALVPGMPTLRVTQGSTATLVAAIQNRGTAVMTDVVTSAPATLPWLSVEGGTISSLAPGASAPLTLTVAAASTQPPGYYRDLVTVQEGSGGERQIALVVQVQSVTRTLALTLQSDQGPLLAGASVDLARQVVEVTQGGEPVTITLHTQGTTDAQGQLLVDLETGTYDYTAQAARHATRTGTLALTAGSGPQTATLTLAGEPELVVTPTLPSIGVVPGQTRSTTIRFTNEGVAPLANLTISSPTTLNWLYLGTPGALPTLEPGESAEFTIYASPPATLTLGSYYETLTVAADAGYSQAVELGVRVTSVATRTLQLHVASRSGLPLTSGTVTLIDQNLSTYSVAGESQTYHEQYTTEVDSAGNAEIASLPPGSYNYVVSAVGYEIGTGSLAVEAGESPQTHSVALQPDPFRYSWQVTPLASGYDITLSLTYDTVTEKPGLFVPSRRWTFDQCTATVLQDYIAIYNPSPMTLTLTTPEVAVPGVEVELGPRPEAVGPNSSVTLPVTATLRGTPGTGEAYIPYRYPVARVPFISYTFNPSSKISPVLAPGESYTALHKLQPADVPGGFMEGTTYTIEVVNPPDHPWIHLDLEPSDPQPWTKETVISATMHITPPLWLTEDRHEYPIMVTVTDEEGTEQESLVLVEISKADYGLQIHTNFEIVLPLADRNEATRGIITAEEKECDNQAATADGHGWIWVHTLSGVHGTPGVGGERRRPPLAQHVPPPIYGYDHQRVRVELSQQAMLEGENFQASLTLENKSLTSPLEVLSVDMRISDTAGVDQTEHFTILPHVPTLLGTVGPGQEVSRRWLLIPAGLEVFEPGGRHFTVQALIHYTWQGQEYTVATVPEPITIYPAPELVIDYELPSRGSRCSTFYLSAYIRNEGLGTARNLRLASAHPVLSSNPVGIPLSFKIAESYIRGISQGPQLNLVLGDIQPGESITATWRITATMPGEFLSFTSDYRNANHRGTLLKPLIREINTFFVRPEGADCELPVFPEDSGRAQEACPACSNEERFHFAGRGVNTRTGNFNYSATDLVVPTIGRPLHFERTYNSQGATDDGPDQKPLGYGWTHRYAMRLIFPDQPGGEPQTIIFQEPHGSRLRFAVQRDGSFQPTAGIYASLQEGDIGPGTSIYTLTSAHQERYVFTEMGQLRDYYDPQGNHTTFTYEGGQLVRVTDPSQSRWLSLAYNGAGLLAEVHDHTGREVSYSYNGAGDLAVVTDTHGLTWQYVYTGTHLLHEIIGPDGQAQLRTFYDAAGHAIRQTDGLGTPLLEVSYQPQGVRVITETGRVITDVYNYQGVLVGQVDVAGHTAGYGFDDSYSRDRRTDANGNHTRYERTPLGLTTSVTDVLGHSTQHAFDARNNPNRFVDALGHTTTNVYDAQNNLVQATNALSGTTSYTYNARGQRTSETDPLGHTTRYEYDLFGQRTAITDSLGAVTRFGYDDLGRVITTTSPLGQMTLNDYDAAGNLTRSTQNPLSGQEQNHQGTYNLITQYEYDPLGRQVSITDTLGRVTRNEYDVAGRLLRTTRNAQPGVAQNHLNQYNLVTSYGYDEFGRQIVVTDTLGRAARMEYDPLGRLGRSIEHYVDGTYDPAHPDEDLITRFAYDAMGSLVSVFDPMGHETRSEYDAAGHVVRIIVNYQDGSYDSAHPDEDLATSYTYDARGSELTQTDVLGRVTRSTYDALGRAVSVTNPISGTVHTEYDAAGHRQQVTDEAGHHTRYGYDEMGRMTVMTDTQGGVTRAEFDLRGNRIAITDAAGRTTRFGYDSLSRMTVVTDALGHVTSYTYDAAGNRLTMTDPAGHTTRYEYDALDRLVRRIANYVEGAESNSDTNVTTEYEYDALGRRVLVRDARGGETHYQYDALGRTLVVTDALSHTTSYTYDALGNRLTETDAAGERTEFVYDAASRLVLVRDALEGETSYAYDAAGNGLSETDPLGVETRTSYDALDRVLVVIRGYQDGVYDAARPDEDVTTSYGYDAVGNRLTMTDTLGQGTTFAYDALRRLLTVTNPLAQTTSYTYDATGNRLSMTDAAGHTTRYKYDALGRVEVMTDSLGGVSTTLYDEVGNRLSVTDAAGRVTTFAYDGLDRTAVITNALGLTTTYRYDAAGNRLSVTDAEGRTTRSEYDVLGRLTRQIANYVVGLVGDSDTNVETDYEYDAVGRRTLVRDGRGGETHLAYDALGRTTVVTDANGLASTFTYDARGSRLSETNPAGETTSYTYDNLGQLVVSEDALGRETRYGYDGLGSRTVLTDANGLQTRYEYDALRRLVAVIEHYVDGTPGGPDEDVTTRYGYDAVGNRTVITNALGYTRTFTYDALNRPTSETNALGHTTRYGYDAVGNRTVLTDAKGVKTSFSYDLMGRLLQIDYPVGETGVSFAYSPVGTRQVMTDATGTTTYAYDELYRLTAVTDGANETVSYQYDALGNRTRLLHAGTVLTYTYDAGSRLETVQDWTGGSYTFHYDLASRPISVTLPNGVTSAYQYDEAGRLLSLTHATAEEILGRYEYELDGVGNYLTISETLRVPTSYFSDLMTQAGPLPDMALVAPTVGDPAGQEALRLPGLAVAETPLLRPDELTLFLETRLGSLRTQTRRLVGLPERATPRTGALALAFVPNEGRTDPSVRFTAQGLGGTLFFAPRELTFLLPDPTGDLSTDNEGRVSPPARHSVRLHFQGASTTSEVSASGEQAAKVHYFLGDDPAAWRHLAGYDRLHYRGLYAGIDLTYAGSDGTLKSTYTVAPGADPTQIQWRYTGPYRATVDEAGVLHLALRGRAGEAGDLLESAPVAWQEVDGQRVPVMVRYIVAQNGTIGFALGAYDTTRDLVIDPELSYGTYLGGLGTDRGLAVATDDAGNVYLSGLSFASSFPTTVGPHGATGAFDVIVTKFDTDGDLVYSTYIGGTGNEYGQGIAVDGDGQVVVVGGAEASGWPIVGGYDSSFAGGTGCTLSFNCRDVVVAKLSANGTSLLYSTYLGGNASDEIANAVALDADGKIYLTGSTENGLPTLSAYDTSYNSGTDAFVAKIDPTLTGTNSLLYSTYLGGGGFDVGQGITVDASGQAYVAGATSSSNFPTATPKQGSLGGDRDAFVSRLSVNGQSLSYSTYLGGSGHDRALGVALTGSNTVLLAGFTASSNFPITNALQSSLGGGRDAFVARLVVGTNTLSYSTYLGGSQDDEARGIVVDSEGQAHVAGMTRSSNFPTEDAIQSSRGLDLCSSSPCADAFVSGLTTSGNALIYSTYLGGSSTDEANGMAIDGDDNLFVVGTTFSANFPVTLDAYDLAYNADVTKSDAFLVKLSEPAPPLSGLFATSDSPTLLGQVTTFTATVSLGDLVSYTWNLGDGTVKSGAVVTHTYAEVGTYSVVVTASQLLAILTDTLTVEILPPYTTLERVISYEYDDLYRLTGAAYSTGESFAYRYDAVGNRTVMTDAGGTHLYTYDAASRLTVADGITHTWDANGNLTADGTRTYSYNAANLLTSVNDGSTASSYVYDGAGNRVSQTVGGVTTRYVLDVAGGLPEVIAATGSGTTHYVQVQGQILGQLDSGNWAYALPDHLGSVRQLSDQSEDITLMQTYAPFGEVFMHEGLGGSAFGFAGEQTDTTGLQHLRARTYGPKLGQFIQADGFDGWTDTPYSLHPYQYGYSNPVRYSDPSGLCIKPRFQRERDGMLVEVDSECWAAYDRLMGQWPHLREYSRFADLDSASLHLLYDRYKANPAVAEALRRSHHPEPCPNCDFVKDTIRGAHEELVNQNMLPPALINLDEFPLDLLLQLRNSRAEVYWNVRRHKEGAIEAAVAMEGPQVPKAPKGNGWKDGLVIGFGMTGAAGPPGTGLFHGAWKSYNSCSYETYAWGQEIVYDFRHQERATFEYEATGTSSTLFASGGIGGYRGFTSGFSDGPGFPQDPDTGVIEYKGYFQAVGVGIDVPESPVSAGVSIGLPHNEDGSYNPQGVHATYIGGSIGKNIRGPSLGGSWMLQDYVMISDVEVFDNPALEPPFGETYERRQQAAMSMAADIHQYLLFRIPNLFELNTTPETLWYLWHWIGYQ